MVKKRKKKGDWRKRKRREKTKRKSSVSQKRDSQSESEITKEEIIRVIRKLKRKKAAGPDGIKNEAWRAGLLRLLDLLHEYKHSMEEGKVPEELERGCGKTDF